MKLTEKNFRGIKTEVQQGRLTMKGNRLFLLTSLLYSGFIVGFSFYIANESTVGWDNLSQAWHALYYIEGALFILQILLFLFCWAPSDFNQKLLSVSRVLYTYKMSLDPFLLVLMFSKDDQTYNDVFPLVLSIITIGIIIHLFMLFKWIRSLNGEISDKKRKKKDNKNTMILIILVVVISTMLFTRSSFLGDQELSILIISVSVVYIAMLIGVVEFIIASYCVFSFSSFRANASSKYHLGNKKKRRKKKR